MASYLLPLGNLNRVAILFFCRFYAQVIHTQRWLVTKEIWLVIAAQNDCIKNDCFKNIFTKFSPSGNLNKKSLSKSVKQLWMFSYVKTSKVTRCTKSILPWRKVTNHLLWVTSTWCIWADTIERYCKQKHQETCVGDPWSMLYNVAYILRCSAVPT